MTRLIEQRLGIRLRARTTRLYLSRWGYAPPPRLCAADEAVPGDYRRWLADDYPGIVIRARDEGAEIRWGHESSAPVVLSTITNKGHQHWMDFAAAPDAQGLIGFLSRLTLQRTNKLFLIHGNLRVHEGEALAPWLVEHDEAIEVFCLPGHAAAA